VWFTNTRKRLLPSLRQEQLVAQRSFDVAAALALTLCGSHSPIPMSAEVIVTSGDDDAECSWLGTPIGSEPLFTVARSYAEVKAEVATVMRPMTRPLPMTSKGWQQLPSLPTQLVVPPALVHPSPIQLQVDDAAGSVPMVVVRVAVHQSMLSRGGRAAAVPAIQLECCRTPSPSLSSLPSTWTRKPVLLLPATAVIPTTSVIPALCFQVPNRPHRSFSPITTTTPAGLSPTSGCVSAIGAALTPPGLPVPLLGDSQTDYESDGLGADTESAYYHRDALVNFVRAATERKGQLQANIAEIDAQLDIVTQELDNRKKNN
jgi:hypothetical protein